MTSQQERFPLLNDADAAERFDRYKFRDPFPKIPAALLNSADIYDYVRTTGMIYPFDSTKLKPASYEASVGETCIYWDKNGKKKSIDLGKEDSFILEKNSIAFVTTREKFRLPDYMAIRFNLTITNVHRGLLLGTGPLVDPGFEGHILIPLHNLTTNPYKFNYKEKLIWLEFTKISPNEIPGTGDGSREPRSGRYVPFPISKKDKKPYEYLRESEIRSSIPDEIGKAKESAERSQRLVTAGTIVGLLTLIVGIGGMYLDVRDITGDIKENQGATGQRVDGLQDRIDELKDTIESKEEQLKAMEKQVNSLQTRIAALEETPEKSVAPKREDPNQAETETNKKIE